MKPNTAATSLKRAIDNAVSAHIDGNAVFEERALVELIRSARIALMELETPVDSPGSALTVLADNWGDYQRTPDNDYSDGYKNGLTDAADELLDWIKRNG